MDGDFRVTLDLVRRVEELQSPPDQMFAHIGKPALALAGSRDLNVAPHHAACVAAALQRSGNLRTRSLLIEGADHNFQMAPDDEETAFRERFTLASFHRPYDPRLDWEIESWLHETTKEDRWPLYGRAIDGPEIDRKTADSPERLQLAPGKASPGDDDAAFVRYLHELRRKLEREREAGAVFRLADLPADHDALSFARRVNPDFDAQFRRGHA